MEKATRQHLKIQNRSLVLKIFFDQPQVSRAEIARITGLTRTTVSDIVADLVGEGLVTKVGMGASAGGKAPVLLSLVDDSHTMVGLDLAYNQFRGAVVDLRGRIKHSICLPVNDTKGEQAIESAIDVLDRLVTYAGHSLAGIGVGTPGLVNSQEGIVNNAVNLEWKNIPLRKILGERYRVPVVVLNDCQAAAMGEFRFGENPLDSRNMVVVRVGYGIGSGVIIDGKIFHGDGGNAGEIGHLTMVENSDLACRCGKTGCLETLASVQAVVRRTATLAAQGCRSTILVPGIPITLDRLVKAYHAGDLLAHEVVDKAGCYLGHALSNLVSTLNIHQIILMGEMTQFGEPWLDIVYRAMLDTSLAGPGQDTHLWMGTLGDNDVILGATAVLTSDYSLLLK